MDSELAHIQAVADSYWFRALVIMTYVPKLPVSWEDRRAYLLDELMEHGGLEGYEYPERGRTIVAWPHRSRRKNPAFIAIHAGDCQVFNAVRRFTGSTFTIEVVEAGKHGLAGKSPVTSIRAQT